MAETLDDLIERLNRLSSELPALVLKNTEIAALDALALADNRITSTGKDANGASFDDYTPSYKKAKTKAGRYRGIVDFTLTGQMLASTASGFERIAPTERSISGGRAKVAFDGRDDLTRKKLASNVQRRGPFLNPSKSELEAVERAANENLKRDIEALFQ